ncbi:MAG: type VI secretion system tip protein TssI/VgrG [Pseudomonadota bacterium]
MTDMRLIERDQDINIECIDREERLILRDATVKDAISTIYTIDALAYSENRHSDDDDFIGKRFRISIEHEDGVRYFSGICTSARLVAHDDTITTFRLRLQPWLWSLTQTVDSRIFQKQTAVEIAKEVFRKYNLAKFSDKTAGFLQLEYHVQYMETDFDFVSRTLEENGIYYFFTQDEDGETLVFADGISAHGPVPGFAQIAFHHPDAEFGRHRPHIYAFESQKRVVPGEVTRSDANFTRQRQVAASRRRVPDIPKFSEALTIYEHRHSHPDAETGELKARLSAESLASRQHLAIGSCNVHGLGVGHRFTLGGHDKAKFNGEYLVRSAYHTITTDADLGGVSDGRDYECHFEVMPASRPFRPQQTTPAPQIYSIQTAVVTGPKGEEIYTNKFGCVKIQFLWDRYGELDENSSCWVRVATPWAGRKWGSLHIPRIGQEVIVQFEDGNPDRPVVTGMLFNAQNMPPYDLPAGATKSGLKSNSSLGGDGANEVCMDDTKGAESLAITAERDFSLTAKNDATMNVGFEKASPGSFTQKIKQNYTQEVESGDHSFTVKTGKSTSTIKAGQVVTVQGEGAHLDVTGERSVVASVKYGTEAPEVTMNGTTTLMAESPDLTVKGTSVTKIGEAQIEVDGTTVKITGSSQISISCGASSITLDASGVNIKGPLVKIN